LLSTANSTRTICQLHYVFCCKHVTSLRDLLVTFHITLFTLQTVFCLSDSGYFFEIVNRRIAVQNFVPVFTILSSGTSFLLNCKLWVWGCI